MSQLKNILSIMGGIPSRYIVADCVQYSTGGYVNTGIVGNPRYTRSLFTVMWQGSNTGTRGLYGVRDAQVANTKSYNVYLTVSAVGPRWDNTGGSTLSSSWSVGETHTVELTHTPEGYGQSIVDGVVVATGSSVMDDISLSHIYINTLYTVSTGNVVTGGTVRWKRVKIWSDGTNLSGEFVPVYDTITQEAGFYELVTKSFFGNDGSGTVNAYDDQGNLITG